MRLTKDKFLEALKARIGEEPSDDDIKFLEDMTDTYKALEDAEKGGGEDWRAKYEENDKNWRQRYVNAFFNPDPQLPGTDPQPAPAEPPEPDPEQAAQETSFDDLFKEE